MPGRASFDSSPLDSLRALKKSGTGFVERVIDTYLGSSATRMNSLRGALAQQDAKAAADAAHPLKSSSAQIGLPELATLAAEMEALARSGSLEGAEDLLARMELEYELGSELLSNQKEADAKAD